jgi:pantoate--beta-alanine ligase
MILFKKIKNLRSCLDRQPESIGFVPTMGALHEGHVSLVRHSKESNGTTVCSIFVNPTQFNDARDFEKYPVTIEKDIELLEANGCDIIFLPGLKEMYPDGLVSARHYELGNLEKILEGKYRPGHFQGVCQVVDRLLDIVRPANLYLGKKDYQQCMVIKRLVELKGWEDKINIIPCPTLREADGLAMSSRNLRLSVHERKKAPFIYSTLIKAKEEIENGNSIKQTESKATEVLQLNGFRVDYVKIMRADNLRDLSIWDGDTKLVILAAAFLGEIRLIDNVEI